MSKRFLLERYLGLTKEEILENEELWMEERENPDMPINPGQELRSVGVNPGGMDADIATGDEMADSELGTADIDTGAGPAPGPTTAPGAAPGGSPAGV
jgi:hypothetical protein